MLKSHYLRILTFGLFMSGGPLVWAQATLVSNDDILQVILFTLIVMALVSLLLTITVAGLIRTRSSQAATQPATQAAPAAASHDQPEPAAPASTPWTLAWFQAKLTSAVPVAREADIDLGHDYDGIRELDNALPPWWKYGFYLSIAWAVVYFCVFHIFGDWSAKEEYQVEMAQAEIEVAAYLKTAANQVDERSVVLLTDASAMEAGQTIYVANCAPCHGQQGEGGIGPTFADQYWIHGGDIASVFKSVKYGIPEKGMIAWQDQLRPLQIQQVSSYLMTFVGTQPPNQKEPQGELYGGDEDGESEETPENEEAPADEQATRLGDQAPPLSMN
jgi:cytochrome c oxidase cbb3-type subunit 3